MWYMPVIIGIYIALPFVSAAVKAFEDVKDFYVTYIIAILIFSGIPTINVFLTEAVPEISTLKFIFDMKFLGGIYGLYLIGGYLIAEKKLFEKVRTGYLLIILAIAFIINSSGQYYLYSNEYFKSTKLLWYTSLPIFVMGLILFELIRRIFATGLSDKVNSIVRVVAGSAFGVYLLHKPILVLLNKYILTSMDVNVMVGIIILLVGGFGISMLVLLPFYKYAKKAGKILFFIK